MWPFSGMSLTIATLVGNIANFLLLTSLIIGVASTFFIVQTANRKEEIWDQEREASKTRVTILENETVQLSAQAKIADARIAQANSAAQDSARQTAEAKLATEQLKIKMQGRRTTSEQASKVSEIKDKT